MSYCRWSSDNWQCDIYCYESDQGYVIHVAGVRPEMPKTKIDYSCAESMVKTFKAQMQEIEDGERIPLKDYPSAGESYCLSTLQELMDKLLELQEEGLNVPGYVFDTIAEEMAEENKE